MSLEYFALAVGFCSVAFSDSAGKMFKNKTEEGYSSVCVCTDFLFLFLEAFIVFQLTDLLEERQSSHVEL